MFAQTPWRDGTTHLVMSPMEFMQLPIDWPVCSRQIHGFCVCSGSSRDSQPLELTARLLTAKLRGQTAAGHGCRGPARTGH